MTWPVIQLTGGPAWLLSRATRARRSFYYVRMTTQPQPAAVLPDYASRVLAVLAAGAVGDAAATRASAGQDALGVTANTQLALYVADGLLEWIEWQNEGQMADAAACVWLACLRWHRTQTGQLPESAPPAPSRWIDERPELRHRRSPDPACLTGLADPGMGVPTDPKNPDAAGCGALVRSAPYGLIPSLPDTHVASFARQGAVLTHGHPAAWTASAAFALMIASAMTGAPLADAVARGQSWLRGQAETPTDAIEAPATATLAAAVDAALAAECAHPSDPAAALTQAVCTLTENAEDSASADSASADSPAPASTASAALAAQLLGAAHGMAVFGAQPGANAGVDELAVHVPGWLAERDVVIEAARRWVAATS